MASALSSFCLASTLLVLGASYASPRTNLAPDAALQELKDGNKRFVEGKSTACADAKSTRSRLVNGQAPDAIVLSCSDSRVPPESVFDQELGKLFVVRVAGNVLDPNAIASIEYAVENLGSRLILILGHESCGAVKAALKTPASGDAGSPSLNHLLREIRLNLGNATTAPDDGALRAPVVKNVSAVAADLLRRSRPVAERVRQGQVKIEQGIYDLGNGKVDFWEGSHAP